MDIAAPPPPKSTCPNCGYCPNCGRGAQAVPYWPYQPSGGWWQIPPVLYPTGPMWIGTGTITVGQICSPTSVTTVPLNPSQISYTT